MVSSRIMSSVQPTPSKDFYVQIGAPDPIIIRYRAGGPNGTLVSFDNTLKFSIGNAGGLVTLGVGSGITLSDDEGVTNARATIQLTTAQSRAIPSGPLSTYSIQRSIGPLEEVILMGVLIGEGGDNADG